MYRYNNNDCHTSNPNQYHCPGGGNIVGLEGVTKVHFPGKKRLDSMELGIDSALREENPSTPSSTYPLC